MNLKVIFIVLLGYIFAITVASVGNIIGERYKLHVIEGVISPLVETSELAEMDRNEILGLISSTEFKEGYRENINSYEREMFIFSVSSFSIQFIVLLVLAGVSSSIINRIYVTRS